MNLIGRRQKSRILSKNVSIANQLLPQRKRDNHKDMLFEITGKKRNNEEYLLNRYEEQAQSQIKSFDKRFKDFQKNMSYQSANKVTLREKSKRINFYKILRARFLKENRTD